MVKLSSKIIATNSNIIHYDIINVKKSMILNLIDSPFTGGFEILQQTNR